MPEPIPCQRHLFDLPDEVAYLNCAYMSPLLKRAAAVGAQAIAHKCRPWQIGAEDFFTESERARALFAELLGAQADDIALVPVASYGLAVAAANLPVAPEQRTRAGEAVPVRRLHVARPCPAGRRRGDDRGAPGG
jgi:kynureninase